jgi:long-subunit acyl-CoA synthetase (AMP-forming)
MPFISQACLFGEAKPFNTLVVVAPKHANADQIANDIQTVNEKLPDYAQIREWIRADVAFSQDNQQLTSNGRLKRDHIWQAYQTQINACYESVCI